MAISGRHCPENHLKALMVGGMEDHTHVLISLPATVPIAKAMQLLKGGSSKWIHETFPEQKGFGWQDKYGAFRVSVSQLDTVIRYIQNQAEHHRIKTFQEELVELLKRHGIDYDERYLWH